MNNDMLVLGEFSAEKHIADIEKRLAVIERLILLAAESYSPLPCSNNGPNKRSDSEAGDE